MRLQSAVLLACGAMLAWTGARSPDSGGEIAVERRPDLRETRYTIASGACRISWTVYETEVNRGVILQHAVCALPLAEQAPLISKLLRKVNESDAEAGRFRTLSWGRLYPDGPKDLTLATRLALAAKRSPQWDAVKGVPRTGDMNGFVRKLANDASIYEELRPVFRQAGIEIRLSSVEKVLVLPARRLEFFESLREAGVRAQDKLPFDCMAWFSLTHAGPGWIHLSTGKGQIEPPNSGTEQTSATVFDIDGDGVNDFIITERTKTPPVTWYRRGKTGWKRYVVETEALRPEAGATFGDVDGDGDLDFIAGADGGGDAGNQVWWWENPAPEFDAARPWIRRVIKNSGGRKHHDLMFADVDGDGRNELVFWNQGGRRLVLARVPASPRAAREWPLAEIFTYAGDSEQEQRATAPPFKSVNEHEGLAFADIDGDGKPDIVGGGLWFKHLGGDRFSANEIDNGYHFSRSAAGQLTEGGRPEVVLVVGDGVGPLMIYEWVKGTWKGKALIEKIDNGHSLALVDFDRDGHLDIFCAEMRLNGGNPESKTYLLLGDGRGGFRTTIVATGFDNHESKIADLDGDGTLDILGKPYNHQTPALNIWLNPGGARPAQMR